VALISLHRSGSLGEIIYCLHELFVEYVFAWVARLWWCNQWARCLFWEHQLLHCQTIQCKYTNPYKSFPCCKCLSTRVLWTPFAPLVADYILNPNWSPISCMALALPFILQVIYRFNKIFDACDARLMRSLHSSVFTFTVNCVKSFGHCLVALWTPISSVKVSVEVYSPFLHP